MSTSEKLIIISENKQTLSCYQQDTLCYTFLVSTAKNGLGEQWGSECTPRGWHKIVSIIGTEKPVNSIFIAREWTGEIYSQDLAEKNPERDWIVTCIMQLEGLEAGKNKGDNIDSFARRIYIHGTPDSTVLGKPGSRGCIRMSNKEILTLADWVQKGTCVYIH